MKEMTGPEKVARLIVALGADVASKIIQHLDEETVTIIALEIAKVKDISVEDKEELIGEFLLEFRKNKGAVFGGENVARDMLKSAFGVDKAAEILKNLTNRDIEKGFQFLQKIDPKILTSFLENEHPQTIAVTLSYILPEQTAVILKNLPSFISKDVVKRIAKLDKTSPEAVLEIVRILRKKYEKMKDSSSEYMKTDGINTIIDILEQMNPDQEKKLMDHFDISMPLIADEIKDRIFNFDNILNLLHQEIQILIDEVRNDHLIAIALKGAGDEMRFKFLRNMSQNRATDIINDMDAMGPIRLSDINEARNYIVRVMRHLNDNKTIIIRKDKEKFVE